MIVRCEKCQRECLWSEERKQYTCPNWCNVPTKRISDDPTFARINFAGIPVRMDETLKPGEVWVEYRDGRTERLYPPHHPEPVPIPLLEARNRLFELMHEAHRALAAIDEAINEWRRR